MKKIALILLLTLVTCPAWSATTASTPAKLSSQDQSDIARIEKYLNDLKSVAASFTQVNDMGEFRHGKIDIQRPGKMRVAYDPPQKDLIVADGSLVHIWDDEMKQQSTVPVGSSIAELILRDPIRLNGDVTITHYKKFPAKLELSLVATNNPGDGELTLIFEDNPLRLRQWRVLDAQGRTTGVNLENPHEGVSFASNTFEFTPPNQGMYPKSSK